MPGYDDLADSDAPDRAVFGAGDRTSEIRRSTGTRQHRTAGRLLLLQDITGKRERELERTNEGLDRYASVVTHDPRNPLDVATGRGELAVEDTRTSTSKRRARRSNEWRLSSTTC